MKLMAHVRGARPNYLDAGTGAGGERTKNIVVPSDLTIFGATIERRLHLKHTGMAPEPMVD